MGREAPVEQATAPYITQSNAKTEADEVLAQRPLVDALIRDVWDHIESTWRALPYPSRRRRAVLIVAGGRLFPLILRFTTS